jgi:hypothetical protein
MGILSQCRGILNLQALRFVFQVDQVSLHLAYVRSPCIISLPIYTNYKESGIQQDPGHPSSVQDTYLRNTQSPNSKEGIVQTIASINISGRAYIPFVIIPEDFHRTISRKDFLAIAREFEMSHELLKLYDDMIKAIHKIME